MKLKNSIFHYDIIALDFRPEPNSLVKCEPLLRSSGAGNQQVFALSYTGGFSEI
ncbi:MAG: hypothetical protein IPG53_10055 [Ignavibacteriales bacterium]|nr:hypothetical protein [Ignavibacteriales bacterium]